ncbi:unnamed protein product [Nippostrongylus brasiliensis]|uniref:MRG domain-containing protein n=1 Tax=Nippostrongylus brasiliensis TaxID=27835 RepID=A0A0N4XDT5_NIPBR|nr:unnamed protein product [Nippostrongylus brasiliensis]
MAPKRDHRYEVNDKVLCKHGLFFYEAKITDVEEEGGEMIYTVHYQGWHKRYDERIPQSQCPEMFLPLTEANIAKAKADIQEASNGSRASTPSDRAGNHIPSTVSPHDGGETRVSGVDSLCSCAMYLRDFFDVVLNYQLLYKPEKPQYQVLAKREQEKFEVDICFLQDGGPLRPEMIRPSKYYGLAHLLRLLVKLPAFLRLNASTDRDLDSKIACHLDFISFLMQNAPFVSDIDLDYKVQGG